MKEIALTQNKIALVDEEAFAILNPWNWYARENHPGYFYAARNIRNATGAQSQILMHREIMRADLNQRIDHIDGNTLNNVKANLRFCDCSENRMHSKIQANRTGYKGVLEKLPGRFIASLQWRNKKFCSRRFDTAKEAALAYNELVLKHCPEWGVLNKV